MEKSNIFRKESLDRVESPEQMDEYIKVSSASVWVILGVLLIAAVSVLVWSVVGTLPETTTLKGVTMGDNQVKVYQSVDGANTNIVGCKVNVTLPDGSSVQGKVETVSKNPYSEEEIRSNMEYDWIAENVIPAEYAYEVVIHTEEQLEENLLATAAITTAEVKPIQFILG